MHRLTMLAVCVAVVFAASACSSDGGSSDQGSDARRTTTTTEADTSEAEDPPGTTETTADPRLDLPEPGSFEAAIAASAAAGGGGTLPLSEEQATCVAPKWVEIAGVERLEEKAVTPAMLQADIAASFATLGLSAEDGTALADAATACDIDLTNLYLESDGVRNLDDETKACVEAEIEDDLVEGILAVSMTQGSDALGTDPVLQEGLTALFTACPGLLGGG